MKRGEVARRLISEGEDAFRMLAVVVWPGRDWAEESFRANLATCTACNGELPRAIRAGPLGSSVANASTPEH